VPAPTVLQLIDIRRVYYLEVRFIAGYPEILRYWLFGFPNAGDRGAAVAIC